MRNGNEEKETEMRNEIEHGKLVHASQKLAHSDIQSLYQFLFARNHGRTDTLILLSVSTLSRMTDSRLKWINLGLSMQSAEKF